MEIVKREDVEQFLSEFHQKLKIRDAIRYINERGKNTQTMFDLELTQSDQRKAIERLTVQDYSGCPEGISMHGGGTKMWVFGKIVKKKEVYIKITIGDFNKPVVCISFHFPLYPMTYPYRI